MTSLSRVQDDWLAEFSELRRFFQPIESLISMLLHNSDSSMFVDLVVNCWSVFWMFGFVAAGWTWGKHTVPVCSPFRGFYLQGSCGRINPNRVCSYGHFDLHRLLQIHLYPTTTCCTRAG